MVRPLNEDGRILTVSRRVHERWVLGLAEILWTTILAIGIGKKLCHLVSSTHSLTDYLVLILDQGQPFCESSKMLFLSEATKSTHLKR